MDDKRLLRNKIKGKLEEISRPEYEHYSYNIAKALYRDIFWQESHIVGITISNKPEVDTYQIIRKAWEEDKKIVVPKCLPKEKKMAFRTLTAFNQLESVYSGLLEPIVNMTEEIAAEEIDLLIVPGLAFSRLGYRLGFGGGYYDRFLMDYHGKTLSLAFQGQIVETVPVERHDLPVAKIITEEEIILINE